MPEHITSTMYYFGVHLLFASIVCLAAWVVTSIPRGWATTKHWIWVATALNFIAPVGALVDKLWKSHLSWAAPLPMIGGPAATITQGPGGMVLFAVWFAGAALMFARLYLRLRADCDESRRAPGPAALSRKADFLVQGVPVKFAERQETPTVVGLLRPYISLPSGIDRVLSEDELTAVLMHEVKHARRRDNLIRLAYEIALCVLWFHPLVWIAGSRLALYRELSCDEPVIQSARGLDLVSALKKLSSPEEGLLLQATASSFIRHRLDMLTARPQKRTALASAVLAGAFSILLLGGILETVAHTACCFLAKK
jgi:beta-lactamase regulating signal transducer with metallopeptidase domain